MQKKIKWVYSHMYNNNLMKKIQEKQFVKVCGAFDVMSAKLAEMNDFDAIWQVVLEYHQQELCLMLA